jgi:hypothetical protein
MVLIEDPHHVPIEPALKLPDVRLPRHLPQMVLRVRLFCI